MRRVIRLLLPMFALALGAACQTTTPTMSLDEARQLTDIASESAFVPPPRTIADIQTLLDPTGLGARGIFRARLQADLPAPEPVDLSQFQSSEIMRLREAAARRYWQRGVAARRLGRFGQAIQDFTRAAELVTPDMPFPQPGWDLWASNFGMSILRELGETEAAAGNHRRAIKHLETAADVSLRRDSGGYYLQGVGLALVEVHARTGDLQAAERVVNNLTRLQHEWHMAWNAPRGIQPPRIQHPWSRASFDSTVAAAQATLLELRGQFLEAERFWRASIAPLASISTRNDLL